MLLLTGRRCISTITLYRSGVYAWNHSLAVSTVYLPCHKPNGQGDGIILPWCTAPKFNALSASLLQHHYL